MKIILKLNAFLFLLIVAGCYHDPLPDAASLTSNKTGEAIGFGTLSIMSADPDRTINIFGTTDQDLDFFLWFDKVESASIIDEQKLKFGYGSDQLFMIKMDPGKSNVKSLMYTNGVSNFKVGMELNFCLYPNSWTYIGALNLYKNVWGSCCDGSTVNIGVNDMEATAIEQITTRYGDADRLFKKSLMTPKKIECMQ